MTMLHRRLMALLALTALFAFISGAGLDAPSVLPAALVLLAAVFVQPGERTARTLEPFWRVAALVLALRATLIAFRGGADPVLPIIDLLLLLLCAESLRARDGSGDARHFALTFALLIASAAYRPGPLFALLFVAYVSVAVVALVIGHLTRQAQAHETQPPAVRPAFVVRVALLSLVVLAVSGLVFLFFPRVSQGWAARSVPLVGNAVIGFSDRVSIGDHGARLEPNPEVVLRVEFPSGVPIGVSALHWRGRSYNHFDGTAWSRTERGAVRSVNLQRWPGPLIEQMVYARPLGAANVLFGLHPVIDVAAQSRIRPVRVGGGDFLYFGESDPVYRVISKASAPHADSLRRVAMEYTPEVMAHLQLPATDTRVLALADSLRGAAPTLYDHVVGVEHWLRTEFSYTLDLPRTRAEASLEHFLFVRRAGHCEYFSTAMAVLLRAAGVPARNVNGFLGGDWNEFGGFLNVTQNNAHSWVEVYFPGWGWVPFDPTPAGGAPGAAAARRRLMPLRFLMDGLEHRWSKWVLDYDLGRQRSLLSRATAPFSDAARQSSRERTTLSDGVRGPGWLIAASIALLIGAVVLWRARGRRADPLTAATRAYLQLRRAYERVGLPPASELPPLAFVAALSEAPGTLHAQRAVALYVGARFGGAALDAAQRAELVDSVEAAQRAVRQARTAGVSRRRAGP
jgi:protein-glutamine gamma-glutamyltransferase